MKSISMVIVMGVNELIRKDFDSFLDFIEHEALVRGLIQKYQYLTDAKWNPIRLTEGELWIEVWFVPEEEN